MTTNMTSFLGDKPVARIGFGAMQLAGRGVWGPPPDPIGVRAVLRRAVELGVDHIDTAQFYGPDVVNDLIREALYPYPAELKLVTKVGVRRDETAAWLPAPSPHELRAGVEANLRALRVERMDLVNLRLFEDADHTQVRLADQLGVLEELRQEGKLDLIGVSNVSHEIAAQAIEITDIAEIQNVYSVIDRTNDPVLELARQHQVAFVPFFPLGSAFGRGHAQIAENQVVAAIAAKHAVTAAQVALAWLLARYERMLLIPGTSSVAHLEDNLAAATVELDTADMIDLDQVAAASA
jgi:aryl-alcohol dehydrogenase-like predicted oxidoreductase